MGMFKIKIDDREVLATLDRIIAKARDRRPLMEDVSHIMWNAVEENFRVEGRPKWKRSKRAIKLNGQTLQNRGILAKSVTPSSDNDSAIVSTNMKYAAVHQFGHTTHFAAKMRIMHFDQRKSGRMTHGRPGKNVDHFAKPEKAKYGMKVQGKAYSVKLVARPSSIWSHLISEKLLMQRRVF